MRFLLLSLEFDAGTFSGNGVYACSQARALTQLGHEVLVIAGAPPGHAAAPSSSSSSVGQQAQAALAQTIRHVELPVWGRLDAGCAWHEYAAGAGTPAAAAAVAAFQPAAMLGVDWHSVAAYEALCAALGAAAGAPGKLPFVYLNYRVYHRTATADELAVIEAQEQQALRASCCSMVLSRSDAEYLRRHFPAATDEAAGAAPLHVLLPALRADMEALPPPPLPPVEGEAAAGGCAGQQATAGVAGQGMHHATAAGTAGLAAQQAAQQGRQQQEQQQQQPQQRRYLTCCVRLSPEKEPHRFVALVEEMQRRGSLQRLGVLPLMCGAGWGSPYGLELRQRLELNVPQCVIHDSFLGPAELAQVYAGTLLNLHPPTYDAYGMTIVEAASQDAPSLVQCGGHVGATDLLSAEAGEVLVCDMEQATSQLADLVESLLADHARLAAVGRRALHKARSWTEHDNARALVAYVQQALEAGGAAGAAGSSGQ